MIDMSFSWALVAAMIDDSVGQENWVCSDPSSEMRGKISEKLGISLEKFVMN